jgi:nitrogen regulatory protein PII
MLIIAREQTKQMDNFSRQQTHLFDSLSTTQKDISESISTRFIGKFPNNIENISEELEKAKHSILIVADVPGYGMFSESEKFEKYYSTLKDIINKNEINVKLLFYDKEPRMNLIKKQFFGGNELSLLDVNDKSIQGKINDEKYKKFRTTEDLFGKSETELSKLNEIKKNLPLSIKDVKFKDFASTLDSMNKYIINHLDSLMLKHDKLEQRSEQHVTEEDFIMHTWIIDGNRAVISFLSFQEESADEISFSTKDPILVNFVKEYANKKFEKAKKKDNSGDM